MTATMPTTPSCATCRYFDADFVPVECCDDPADALGLCSYPRTLLPLSEQGVPSERRPVGPHETGCPTHEVKPTG